MLLHTEEINDLDKEVQGFLTESASWDLEKLFSMGVGYQMVYHYAISSKIYLAITEQTKVLKEILEATQKKSELHDF